MDHLQYWTDISTEIVFFGLLRLTKLFALQLAILSKSSLREEESLVLMEDALGKIVEECKVESSAYECIGLDVTERINKKHHTKKE